MAYIIETLRKSAVLKHPALPCLSSHYTINLLAGCPYGCKYCYAQSFQCRPQNGGINFYVNTFDKLKKELPRKRRKPELVYFSTACEPFAPYPQMQQVLFNCMSLLLDASVSILISTKSPIPERFLELFNKHPGKVTVQMGLITADDSLRKILEPHAASVNTRLGTVSRLLEMNIATEIRIDPLIPELTDDEYSLKNFFERVGDHGVRYAAVSYLFIRPSLSRSMNMSIEGWHYRDMTGRLYDTRIDKYCGSGSVMIPSKQYRTIKYIQIQNIASSAGVSIRFCQCKNPDLTNTCCHERAIASVTSSSQIPLL